MVEAQEKNKTCLSGTNVALLLTFNLHGALDESNQARAFAPSEWNGH